MQCQCLLANELMQSGYGHASNSHFYLAPRLGGDSQPLPLIESKRMGGLRGVPAWRCTRSVIFLPSHRN
jgi:hypothetical protein